jgi:uncharacterized membrane protein
VFQNWSGPKACPGQDYSLLLNLSSPGFSAKRRDVRTCILLRRVARNKGFPMHVGFVLALAFGIGLVAGLRTFTAPAVTAWAVGILSLGVAVESVVDQLPNSAARTTAPQLSGRIIMGSLTDACLGIAGSAAVWLAVVMGAIGSLVGAFGGYRARVRLVRALHAPDLAIAILEDLVAIGLGLLLASRF